jgi:HEAT repeat protein
MKRNLNLTAALLMGGMLLVASTGNARNDPNKLSMKNKQAVENLKNGIKSDNNGLKRSSIYYAGFYRMTETVPALTEILKKESDPKTRILIALVLYKIGDGKGIDLVKEMSEKDSNKEVRRMCTCIYNAYLDGNSDLAALTGMEY